MIDDDSPEWTEADFRRAIPFSELPEDLRRTLSRRGRPPKANAKQSVSLRLSPDVLAWFKASGPGWQTRIDEALRKAAGL